jgi:diguanylate cyclase (GGDEF)-like protein/PAS domain S-box-containing protein
MDGIEVFDALDCGVALFDSAGRIVFWNAWLTRRSGIAATTAHGQTLGELFGPAVSLVLVEAVEQACRLGLASVLSNQLHRKVLPLHRPHDGEAVEQSAAVRPLRGGRLCCLLQVNDVSAAVRRERHLRQTQAAVRLRNRAIEASSQGIIIVDALQEDMPIIYANPAFARITGYDPEAVVGDNCRFLHGADGDQPGLAEIRQAIAEHREGIAVIRNYRKDGTAFWNELMVAPVFDAARTVTHFVGIQRDITARRAVEEARDAAVADLKLANDRLFREKDFTDAVLRTVGALVAVVDRRGRIVSFNRACEMVTGLPEAQAVGTRLGDLIPDAAAAGRFRLDDLGGAQGLGGLTTGLLTASGEERTVRWTFTTLRGGEGVASHLICTGIDVTDRDRAAALLRAERVILEMVARAEPLPSIATSICLAVEEQLPGRQASLLLMDQDRQTLHHCASPSLPAAFRHRMNGVRVGLGSGSCGAAAFSGQPDYTADVVGAPHWADLTDLAATLAVRSCWSTPILSSTDLVLGTFAVYGPDPRLPDDVAAEVMQRAARLAAIAIERHQAAERIRYLALYDQLTGLANRSLLSDRLHSALAQARRATGTLALLFVDLDGFKTVNDRFGHDAGDALLAAIGRRFRSALRETDTAARIGGDEFVVLAADIGDRRDAEQIADKVISALSEPVYWGSERLVVGASIGLVLYPDDATTADGLLTLADDAMYLAKGTGKNRWAWPKGVPVIRAVPTKP